MINRLILMGRLTADPVFLQTTSGVPVCKFTVASNRNYKGANGEQQADFINCVAWRSTAEFISKYFSKGSMIIIEGTLQNNNYESNGVKHYSYVVQVDNVQFGESKAAASSTSNQNPATVSEPTSENSIGSLDDYEEILSDGDTPF